MGLNLVTQVGFSAGNTLFFQHGTTNYLFDIDTGAVTSITADLANPSFTPDGCFVVGERKGSYSPLDTNSLTDVYLLDLSTGNATLVSVNRESVGAGNGKSISPAVSPDGRYVLFRSRASNLVLNDMNAVGDVFLRDLVLKRTILLSTSAVGTGAANWFSGNPIFSQDGSTAILESYANDAAGGDFNDWEQRAGRGPVESPVPTFDPVTESQSRALTPAIELVTRFPALLKCRRYSVRRR